MTRKTRRHNAVLLSLVGIGLALLVLVVYIASADHGYLKPELERRLTALLGRQVVIDGDLHLSIRENIRVSVDGLRIVAGEDWTEKPDLLRVGSLAATVRTLSLVEGPVEILDLRIDDTLLCLEKHPDGRVNWRLGPPETRDREGGGADESVPVVLRAASITRTRAVLKTPDLDERLYVRIDSLLQAIDEQGVIDSKLTGSINDTALDIALQVENLPKLLAGRDVKASIDGSLGKIHLAGDVLVDDLAQPERPALNLALQGPHFAYLAEILKLPEHHSGELTVNLKLRPQDDKLAFDIDSEIGTFIFQSQGTVNSLADLRAIDARVQSSGMNAAAVAAVFGVERVPALPFSLSGHLENHPGYVGFDDLRVTLGDSVASATGSLRPADDFAFDVELALQGPDAAAAAAWFELPGVPAQPYSASARVRSVAEGFHFDDLRIDLGPNELHSKSATLRAGDAPTVDMDFSASGPDAADIAAWFDIAKVPGGPFSVAGRLSGREGLLRLDSLQATVDGNRLSGQMTIRTGSEPGPGDRLDAELSMQGPDAAKLAAWFDVAHVPPLPFTAKARVRPRHGALRLDELQVDIGPNELRSKVAVFQSGASPSLDMDFTVAGPDAARVAGWFDLRKVPAEMYSVTGRLTRRDGSIRLDDLDARIGAHEFGGGGSFRPGDVSWLDVNLTAARLDLSDYLGQGDGEPEPVTPARDNDGRAIPNSPIPLEQLAHFKGSLRFDVSEIVVDAKNFRDVHATVQLNDRQLLVEKFELVGEAGGRLTATLAVKPVGDAGEFHLQLDGKNVELWLPAENDAERKQLPRYEINAALEASGRTLRELAASANGYVRMASGPGRVRIAGIKLFTNAFLSQLLRTMNPFLEEDSYTEVECAVLFATVENGIVHGKPGLVVRSKHLNVIAEMQVDLATEALSANINTLPRQGLGISVSNLVMNPFTRVGGTIAKPHFEIDEQSTLIQGGAAIATGGLSLIAKSLFDRATAGDNPCLAAEEAAAPAYETLARKYGGDLSDRQ